METQRRPSELRRSVPYQTRKGDTALGSIWATRPSLGYRQSGRRQQGSLRASSRVPNFYACSLGSRPGASAPISLALFGNRTRTL